MGWVWLVGVPVCGTESSGLPDNISASHWYKKPKLIPHFWDSRSLEDEVK